MLVIFSGEDFGGPGRSRGVRLFDFRGWREGYGVFREGTDREYTCDAVAGYGTWVVPRGA